MSLSEVMDEIRNSGRKTQETGTNPEKPASGETPPGRGHPRKGEDVEAYRARMMRKEEARCLKNAAVSASKGSGRKRHRSKRNEAVSVKSGKGTEVSATRTRKSMVSAAGGRYRPLIMFESPGIPKGKIVAVCIMDSDD